MGTDCGSSPGALDVDEFVRLAREGRDLLGRGESDRGCLEASGRAHVVAWRAPVRRGRSAVRDRPDQFDGTELRLQASADMARAAISSGSGADEIAGLPGARCRGHPLRDDFVEILMRALDQSSRTPEALAAYGSTTANCIADELGSDPAPALQALHLDLLRAAPAAGCCTSRRSNVPSPLTRLVGRDDEVARVSKTAPERAPGVHRGPGWRGQDAELATELAGKAMRSTWTAFVVR